MSNRAKQETNAAEQSAPVPSQPQWKDCGQGSHIPGPGCADCRDAAQKQSAREWAIAYLKKVDPPKKPTILELEALLESEPKEEITILPDGSITVGVADWIVEMLEAYAAQQSAGLRAERDRFKNDCLRWDAQYRDMVAERDEITRQRDEWQTTAHTLTRNCTTQYELREQAESELSALRTQLDKAWSLIHCNHDNIRFPREKCEYAICKDFAEALRSKEGK